MADPVEVFAPAALTGGPVIPDARASLLLSVSLFFGEEFEEAASRRMGVSSPAVPVPVLIAPVAKARVLAFRPDPGADLTLLLTSAAGAAQKIPLTGVFMWQSPRSGDEITAVALQGIGAVTFVVVGE